MAENNKTQVVIVTEKVYRKGQRVFESAGNLTVIRAPEDEHELSRMIGKENPIAIVIGTEKYTGHLYESLQEGALIARFGVGCDGVDFAKARAHGLFVTNTPDVLESTVAEFTVFLAAEVLRKTGFSHEQTKRGEWLPRMGNDLNGRTWAIIGIGNIGKKLSKILSFGFGVKVFACKRNTIEADKIEKQCGAVRISSEFAETVGSADIVSIHIPANHGTYHFLNNDRLKLLKPGAVIINTGRGSLIDEQALYDLLKSGHLGGAGLDVFENEPYVPMHPDKDLRTLHNVVLTPHIGSSTIECAERMAKRVMRNIQFCIKGEYLQMDIIMA